MYFFLKQLYFSYLAAIFQNELLKRIMEHRKNNTHKKERNMREKNIQYNCKK
jgi:predicted small metal-binding protein